jgi:hypothetical protein
VGGQLMGAELIGLVFAGYSTLPGNQFKVLTRMAFSALDQPNRSRPARIYTGGWEPLSMAIGREIPYLSADPDELMRRRKTLRHEVSKICTALRKAGAIEPLVYHPQPGEKQSWKLTLTMAGQLMLPVEKSPDDPPESKESGGTN